MKETKHREKVFYVHNYRRIDRQKGKGNEGQKDVQMNIKIKFLQVIFLFTFHAWNSFMIFIPQRHSTSFQTRES